MTLKDRITEDMKAAMRQRDCATVQFAPAAAIKAKEVDDRIELDDAAIVAVIDKMLKQRRDSISQHEVGRASGFGRRRKVRGVAAQRLYARDFPAGASTPQLTSLSPRQARQAQAIWAGHGHTQTATRWTRRHDRSLKGESKPHSPPAKDLGFPRLGAPPQIQIHW